MTHPAAIIDTNVVVSGLLTSEEAAPTRRLVDGMLAGDFPFYLSIDLLAEYREVLLRPKIQTLHGLPDEDIDALLEVIAANGILREPTAAPDPNDQFLWNLLEAQPRALLVTGDKALLEDSGPAQSVISPASYLRLTDST
jgi:uncharacterized protein